MRVWTRQHTPNATRQWITTDNNQATIAWLQNALLLQLGESPFWADWGVPVASTFVTQIWPDYHIAMTQQRFADYVTSLRISRDDTDDTLSPSYTFSIIFNDGSLYQSNKNQFNQNFSQTGPFYD